MLLCHNLEDFWYKTCDSFKHRYPYPNSGKCLPHLNTVPVSEQWRIYLRHFNTVVSTPFVNVSKGDFSLFSYIFVLYYEKYKYPITNMQSMLVIKKAMFWMLLISMPFEVANVFLFPYLLRTFLWLGS